MAKITWVFQNESGTNLNRYIATNVNTGEEITFDLLRNGNISVVGTPLNAENMNSLINAINTLYDEIENKLNSSQGTDNANKVAITDSNGNITFTKTIPSNNLPSTGISVETAKNIETSDGTIITGDEMQQKFNDMTNSMTTEVLCKHALEITGNTGDEHGIAVEDQQMLITKIEGQTFAIDGQFVNSNCNLISTGRNLFDEEVEYGSINSSGNLVSGTTTIRAKNYNLIVGGVKYFFQTSYPGSEKTMAFFFYDENKAFVSRVYEPIRGSFTAPTNAKYFKIGITADYGTIYNNDICINVSDVSFNGTYEPYKKDTLIINKELQAFNYIDVKAKRMVYQASDYITLDGSADEVWTFAEESSETYNYCNRFDLSYDLTDIYYTSGSGSEYYRGQGVATIDWIQNSSFKDVNKTCITLNSSHTAIYILIPKDEVSDLNGFYNWLKANPITLFYKKDSIVSSENILNYNIPSGMAVYKNGLQIQDGIVPYALTKEYSVNIAAQIKANINIDRLQQTQIDWLKENGGSGSGNVGTTGGSFTYGASGGGNQVVNFDGSANTNLLFNTDNFNISKVGNTINVNSILGLSYSSVPPTSANTSGLKIVILDSSIYPRNSVTQYNGYLYLWY